MKKVANALTKAKVYQGVSIKAVTLNDSSTVAIIEGYASLYRHIDGKIVVDRDNEIVNTDNLLIDNYRNNPVICYNHDWDLPIGTAIEITKNPSGLYVKAEIHKLTGLEYIFEGVVKGIIKTFSLGFVPHNYDYYEGDVLEITDAELFEISLAPVQSNPGAIFTVIGTKSLGVNASIIKEQNNMTCDDISCMLKSKGKNVNIEGQTPVTKAPEVPEPVAAEPVKEPTPAEPAKEPAAVESVKEPVDTPAVEQVKEPVKEPTTPKSDPVVDLATLVNSIAEAQLKADELRKQKADADKAKEDADKQAAIDADKARVQGILDYITAQAETVKSTPIESLDIDTYDPIYEAITTLQEAIESKVMEAIEASKQAS